MSQKIHSSQIFSWPETEAERSALLGRALLDADGDALLGIDADQVLFFVNHVAKSHLGIERGAHLADIFPELGAAVRRTLLEGISQTEGLMYRESAGYLARISPVRQEGRPVGAICRLVENVQVEEAMRQMRFFQEVNWELDAIIDSSSDGLFVCDGEGTVIRMNPASERIHKLKAADIIGRNMNELVAEGFIDRSAALEAIRRRSMVSILQQKAGRKLISTGTPVFDGEGRVVRVVVSERDTTEIDTLQRQLEEQQAFRDQALHQMVEMQQQRLTSRHIIARSPPMLRALQQAVKVAGAVSSVLILGESGVGKGLIADLVHHNSNRADRPLIRINCGAIPESLIESELFGYEKGAFTGAQASGKPGYFELADGGTLFLDEVAELPLSSQVKLLRFLEDGCVTRLGGAQVHHVDVRVLAATHRNLEEMVEKGAFRLDLYYRLNVIPIHVPAVRERHECVLPLVRHYLDHFGELNSIRKRLTPAASDALQSYAYPGNVRELMNICERLVVMCDTELIDLPDLPADIARHSESGLLPTGGWPAEMSLEQILESVERDVLRQAREQGSNQSEIARRLGVNQSTVARKLKKYGVG